MRKLILFPAVAFCLSCGTKAGNEHAAIDSAMPAEPGEYAIPTTALEVDAMREFPAPFHLDSLVIKDTAYRITATCYFPSTGKTGWIQFDNAILEFVRSKANGRDTSNHPQPHESTTFETWIGDLYRDRDLVSMYFTDQSFTSGAAHYNHNYSTLNFDLKKGQTVFLHDIFRLDSDEAKQEFCDSVNGGPEDTAPYYERLNNHVPILDTADLHPRADFMIGNGLVTFFFDDYEKGPSMQKTLVPLKALSKFLRPEYAWLAQK